MSDNSILILDMSYTFKMFNERGMGDALTYRNLSGFFKNVISVHPLAGLLENNNERFGKYLVNNIDNNHIFIEGKVGVSSLIKFLPPVNFILSQIILIRYLIKVSKKHKVNVIRIGDPYYLGIVGLIISRIIKVPLVIRIGTRYDDVSNATNKPIMKIFLFRKVEKVIERIVLSKCDLIAGANKDNMDYAIENGGRKEVSTIFRYGNLIHKSHWVDVEKRSDNAFDLQGLGLRGKFFTITVGRLEATKEVDSVIKVIAELRNRGLDIYGLIVGGGSTYKDLNQLAHNLNVDKYIIFAGYKDQEWLSRVTPSAAIALSPHMGRALVEVSLSSIPVVAYDYDWQREVVRNGDTGYIVKNHDWLAMADMSETLLRNEPHRLLLGKKNRKKMIKMMCPDILRSHEILEYTKLINKFYI
jgi:glycosyltransferase involved in cell wall biosynthesis